MTNKTAFTRRGGPPWPPVSDMSICVAVLRREKHGGLGQAQGPVPTNLLFAGSCETSSTTPSRGSVPFSFSGRVKPSLSGLIQRPIKEPVSARKHTSRYASATPPASRAFSGCRKSNWSSGDNPSITSRINSPCASLRLGVMVRLNKAGQKRKFSFLTLKQEESGNVG